MICNQIFVFFVCRSYMQFSFIANNRRISTEKWPEGVWRGKGQKEERAPPVTNNIYWAWKSSKKVLMQTIQKFCADFEYVNLKSGYGNFLRKITFSHLMNPEMCFKVVLFTWNFGYEPKIGFYVNLIFLLFFHFDQSLTS